MLLQEILGQRKQFCNIYGDFMVRFSIWKNRRQKYPNELKLGVQIFYMEKLICLYAQKFSSNFYIEKFG